MVLNSILILMKRWFLFKNSDRQQLGFNKMQKKNLIAITVF